MFDEFLDAITEGREELKERFMMALGYLLIEPSNGKYFFVMGYAPNSGKSIMVNHWGTIILAEPLELPDDGRRYIDEESDWNYDPFGGAEKNQKPCVTVEEFIKTYGKRE